MFQVFIEPSVLKKLKKLNEGLKLRLLHRIKELRDFPETRFDVKKMHGVEDIFRLRVGEWRIIFHVFWESKEIVVFDLDTRGRVY